MYRGQKQAEQASKELVRGRAAVWVRGGCRLSWHQSWAIISPCRGLWWPEAALSATDCHRPGADRSMNAGSSKPERPLQHNYITLTLLTSLLPPFISIHFTFNKKNTVYLHRYLSQRERGSETVYIVHSYLVYLMCISTHFAVKSEFPWWGINSFY